MSDDPLHKLIVDDKELDREKLASLILGNLGISKDGVVVILPGFVDLTTKSKILCYLLAKKASKVMTLSDSESAATKEIAQKTGLPEGTVSRELFELKDMRLIANEQGYFIPDYAVHLISIDKKSGESKNAAESKAKRKSNRKNNSEAAKTKPSDKANQLLQVNQESISPGLIDLMLKPGLYLERSLAVLKIARENGIEELTPAEIENFLKNKIRAGGIWKSNISLYLGKKGTRYVDRFRDSTGSGFAYRIMAPGEKLLEDLVKSYSLENEQPKIQEHI